MSSTILLLPRAQLCNRSCSNKHTRRTGVFSFSPHRQERDTFPQRREPRQGGYFSHLHDEGVIFPPIDEGFLSSVVVGSGRHPAEMKPHRSITPTTAWKGDFALVETNLKLFTSTRRTSQRKSACGSPQHIPNCRQKSHHHLQINEGQVRRGRTQQIPENALSRPDNPENAFPRPR